MWSDLRYRLRALVRRDAVERELDQELRFHLDQQIAKEMQAGASRDEAERRARRAFGGLDQVKDASRDGRGIAPIEILGRDLRFAARLLAKSPGFTLVAILSLTLGIGANTAMFQLLNALVLAPLPIAHPETLVDIRMSQSDVDKARGSFTRSAVLSYPLWQQIREGQDALDGLFAWSDETFNLAPTGDIRRARGLWVSGEIFPTLGVRPLLGRFFTPADDRSGCGLSGGAVVSYDFWQRELAGDLHTIGRTLTLNTVQVDVIGVAPSGFYGLEVGKTFDVALPLCAIDAFHPTTRMRESGTTFWLMVMGHLKPGWTLARADARLRALSPAIFAASVPAEYPPANVHEYRELTLHVLPPASSGMSGLRDHYATPLWLLLAMTGLVLLIACANLANLMITRSAVRSRELALRLALGASRGRLLSQLLSESLLIAMASASLGLLLANVISHALITLLETRRDRIVLDLGLDWRVFAFTAGTAALTCVLVGLVPALKAASGSPGDVLKAGSRGATRDRESLTLRRTLLAAQVAVSLVLVAGAILFVRSFRNVLQAPLGFQQDGVLVVDTNLPAPAPSAEVSLALRRDLRDRLRALPGVEGVAETAMVPLSGGMLLHVAVWIDGTPPASGRRIYFNVMGPDAVRTLGIPLRAGRDFIDRDVQTRQPVAIVNETVARLFTNGANPVGKRFRMEATPITPETSYEIVGLVGDTKYRDLREDHLPIAFLPFRPGNSAFGRANATFLVRASVPLDMLAAAVRPALLNVNPNLQFVLRVWASDIRETTARDRAMAMLSALFGGLAALLAAIGLHGLIAYGVERRRREIGIRLALGASRGTIVASVLRESGTCVVLGLTFGVLLSLALARTAQTLLVGVEPGDPGTIAAALAGLALVALLASYLPAQRAARIDPMMTLKDE